METRVAVMSIIVENGDAVEKLNGILHEYGDFIIGRMGIPYRKRKVNIIAIALDAPQNTISAAAAKFACLYAIVVLLICWVLSPALLESGVMKPPMLQLLPATFSWPQLFTALIGGAVALMILPVLKKALHK